MLPVDRPLFLFKEVSDLFFKLPGYNSLRVAMNRYGLEKPRSFKPVKVKNKKIGGKNTPAGKIPVDGVKPLAFGPSKMNYPIDSEGLQGRMAVEYKIAASRARLSPVTKRAIGAGPRPR
ncbi:MAG: hypothetical protein HY889_00995 [Deltaproteobacteria bacterium]|nr:hypothetical protein [Deltaproteobacteria bacterium]